jgi:DNA-binding response OmpR family regulator
MLFYADDDLDDLEFFKEAAESIGRKVVTFTAGDDLMYQLKNPPPTAAIVFLDINMPRKSGLQILEEIRASELWRNLPVVMFSTAKEQEVISKSRELGANYYLPKPKTIKELEKSIAYVLEIDWKRFEPTEKSFVYS